MELNKQALLEALLFITEDPLPLEQLQKMLDLDEKETKKLLEQLQDVYNTSDHGLRVWQGGGGYQLATAPELQPVLEPFFGGRRDPPLTRAALEVLAIIAHRQPVTRVEIEMLRGVRSQSALDSLIKRSLIRIVGRKDAPGKPLLYGTTEKFLHYFGLDSLEDLPPLNPENSKSTSPAE